MSKQKLPIPKIKITPPWDIVDKTKNILHTLNEHSMKVSSYRSILKSGLEELWSYKFVRTSLMIPRSIWELFLVIYIFHNGGPRFFKYSPSRFVK